MHTAELVDYAHCAHCPKNSLNHGWSKYNRISLVFVLSKFTFRNYGSIYGLTPMEDAVICHVSSHAMKTLPGELLNYSPQKSSIFQKNLNLITEF